MCTAPYAEPTHNFSAQYGATKNAPYSFGIALFPGPAHLLTILQWEGGWELGTRLLGLLATQLQVTYLCVLPCEGEGVWSSLEE